MFLIFFVIAAVFVCLFIILQNKIDQNDLYLVAIFGLITILVTAFIIKPKIMLHTFNQRYLLTLKNGEEPFYVQTEFDNVWLDEVVKKGFEYFYRSDAFDILFNIIKSQERKLFSSLYTLRVITIIKHDKFDFFDSRLDEQYKALFTESSKKKGINSQINIQFKKYPQMRKEEIEELNNIISFKEGKNSLITINCGYFENDSKVYFLHSKKYFQTKYYKEATHFVYNIVNKEF